MRRVNRAWTWRGAQRRGLTLLETLISLGLSALVVMAAMTLVPAYGYNMRTADEQLLQSRGLNLYSTVHEWLSRAETILGTYKMEFAIDEGGTMIAMPPEPVPGQREFAMALVTANMGDRNNDGQVNYDEVEGLLWQLNMHYIPSGVEGGSTLQFIRHTTNAAVMATPLAECDSGAEADHQWGVPDAWFLDDPSSVELEPIAVNLLVRWSWDPPSLICGPAADPFFLDMNFSIMDLDEYAAVAAPWMYSFDVAATTSGAAVRGGVD